MPPKTISRAIKDALEQLTKEGFEAFCDQLLDRREEPRVRRNKVDGKSFLVIANVLVQTFTEAGAARVAEEILREIDCNSEADQLVADIAGLTSSTPASGDHGRRSAGAAAVNTVAGGGCTGAQFVDKHRLQLIERVKNIGPIFDELLDKGIVQQESYDEILASRIDQEKMRKLYSGPLTAAGPDGKDVFYAILEEREKYLIADLKKKK